MNTLSARFLLTLSLVSLPFLANSAVAQEDLNVIFKKVNELVEQKNYTKALEELKWAENEIQKLNSNQVGTFFPEELVGYKGGKLEINSVMGMTNLERLYSKEDHSVTMSLVGGGGAMAGIAGLGKMAMMMGGGTGANTLRIQGQTASLTEENGSAEMQIFLDSGSILSLRTDGEKQGATLKAMAEALKLGELDRYLKGAS